MFTLDFKVRDYECDIQGIVNNATYQNYLEHARHEFLLERGIDFAQCHQEGKDLVLAKLELEYKAPLKPGDLFYVTVDIEKEGRVKMVFVQNIYRKTDDKLVVKARATAVCIINGKPRVDEGMMSLLFA
ncbi:MAG: acyl-CoA thioesterase [Lentisphaeraceae bacterium]|nr:acyl-CoA thioesterase [Lentisphaeraceae bacterium]